MNAALARSKVPLWFRFPSADMIVQCEGLSAVAAGILLQLLPRLHQAGEPIRRDHAALARLCGTTKPAFECALAELKDRRLIIEKGGGLWSEFIEREIDHHAEKSMKTSKSVSKRWEKAKQNQSPADTNVSPEVEVEQKAKPTASPFTDSAEYEASRARREAIGKPRLKNPPDGVEPGQFRQIDWIGIVRVEAVKPDSVIVADVDDGEHFLVAISDEGVPLWDDAERLDPDDYEPGRFEGRTLGEWEAA